MADEREEPSPRAVELFQRFLEARESDASLTIEKFADQHPAERKQLLRMWKWSRWFDAWRHKRDEDE